LASRKREQTYPDCAGEPSGGETRLKFGGSPFGIWRNQFSDLNGSLTNGAQSFDDMYADSRRWFQEKWVDYLASQIYWNMGFNIADYGVLVPWWNTAFANERHL
jgi:uncharacterized lipoprotein YddW (UPF0748 family)